MLAVIVTITARSKCTLTVIVSIMGRYICSINSYRDNNGEVIYAVLTVIVIITGKSMCSVYIDCDNNGEVYMQCKQLV